MTWIQKSGIVIAVGAALIIGALLGGNLNAPATAQGGKGAPGGASAGGPRYSVVETEGIHLIVTDNSKNVVFFYTVDEGEKPGSDLHLRGSIDLNRVGDSTIKPVLLRPKKKAEDGK